MKDNMKANQSVIYLRQSSGKEEESESLQMQLEKCLELAQERQLEVQGVFRDANCSGRLYPRGAENLARMDRAFQLWYRENSIEKRSRPGLQGVLDCLGKICYVVVYDMTRLYRPLQNSYLQGYVDSLLIEHSVRLLSVKEGLIDPANFSDCLVCTIKSQVNDNQIRLTTEKSRLALAKLRDSGYYGSCPKMYGVRYLGGKERAIEIEKAEAELVRFVFAETLKRQPYNWIVREMNRRFGVLSKGRGFYSSTYRNIVSQAFYCGYMQNSQGKWIPARQMAGKELISLEEWRRCQEILKEKRHGGKRTTGRHALPFSGKLRCGYCGARMIAGCDRGRLYYFCLHGMQRGNAECGKSRVVVLLHRKSGLATDLTEAIRPVLLGGYYGEWLAAGGEGEAGHIRDILDGRLSEKRFCELLRKSVQSICCYYDVLRIECEDGTLWLPRSIQGPFRHFPRFSCNIGGGKDGGRPGEFPEVRVRYCVSGRVKLRWMPREKGAYLKIRS